MTNIKCVRKIILLNKSFQMYSYISIENVITKPELFTSTLLKFLSYSVSLQKKYQIKWVKHTLANINIFIFVTM